MKKLNSLAQMPQKMTDGSAGYDLRMADPDNESLVIQPGEVGVVKTGLAFQISRGWEVQIRSRSSLGFKHKMSIPHGIGTIDSDYRGEILVPLLNHSDVPFVVNNGDRIAQALIARVEFSEFNVFEEAIELTDTRRGAGGWGSTGTS